MASLGPSSECLIVQYVEGVEPGSLRLGDDAGTNAALRSAAESARDSGEVTISQFVVATNRSDSRAIVHLVSPVYQWNAPVGNSK